MAKKETENGTALAVLESKGYVALLDQAREVQTIIHDNLGNGQMTPQDLPTIKMPTGGGLQWTVPGIEGDQLQKEIEGIVVYWREPRAFWRVSMEEGSGNTPPDCTSTHGVEGKGEFGAGSPGNPSGKCATCPMSQWGTGKKARGQACKQMRVLFVLLPGEMLPVALRLAPTSVKTCGKFFMQLASKGLPYLGVLMNVGLSEQKNKDGIKYAAATFRVGKVLSKDEAERVRAYHQTFKGALDTVEIDMGGGGAAEE